MQKWNIHHNKTNIASHDTTASLEEHKHVLVLVLHTTEHTGCYIMSLTTITQARRQFFFFCPTSEPVNEIAFELSQLKEYSIIWLQTKLYERYLFGYTLTDITQISIFFYFFLYLYLWVHSQVLQKAKRDDGWMCQSSQTME